MMMTIFDDGGGSRFYREGLLWPAALSGKDLIAVASNALRAPDADVVAMLAALESSPFSEVREMAREVRGSLAEMHASGKQSADFDLASAEHMAELVDMLEHRCRAA